MKHLVIGQRLKTPNFSAIHWSPRGSLVSIGQHFVATRVVHLPKSTETSLITESDQSGPNHQLLQLCTARTAWSDSDQAVRAVHSCNSWLLPELVLGYENRCLRCLECCIHRYSCTKIAVVHSDFNRLAYFQSATTFSIFAWRSCNKRHLHLIY